MARVVKQSIPKPPPTYSQEHAAQMAEAINRYMIQRESQGEEISGRFICTDPVAVPGDLPDTSKLPTGTLYLRPALAASADSSVVQQVWATGSLTLTTAAQPIPGASLTLSRAGRYLFIATFDFIVAGNENNYPLYGTITGATHNAICDTASKTGRNTVSQSGIESVTAGQTIQMLAYKGGGGGTSSVDTESNLIAIWIAGPAAAGAAGADNGFLTVVGKGDP